MGFASTLIQLIGITRDDGRVQFISGIKKHLDGAGKSGVLNRA